MIKLRRFRLRKCHFGVLVVQYKQSGLSKTLTRFWPANSVKYENVIVSALKSNTSDLEHRKGKTKVEKQGVRSLYLFEIARWKLNSDLANLTSFSVIYRFVGLRHEITEICSINQKHRSNWTVTLTASQYTSYLIIVCSTEVLKVEMAKDLVFPAAHKVTVSNQCASGALLLFVNVEQGSKRKCDEKTIVYYFAQPGFFFLFEKIL